MKRIRSGKTSQLLTKRNPMIFGISSQTSGNILSNTIKMFFIGEQTSLRSKKPENKLVDPLDKNFTPFAEKANFAG